MLGIWVGAVPNPRRYGPRGVLMVGWRFWVLLAVAAVFGFWALSSLLAVDDEAPAFYRSAVEEHGESEPEQIGKPSRDAMRNILRDAEGDAGGGQ